MCGCRRWCLRSRHSDSEGFVVDCVLLSCCKQWLLRLLNRRRPRRLEGLLLLLFLKTPRLPATGDVLHMATYMRGCRCLLLHVVARFAVLWISLPLLRWQTLVLYGRPMILALSLTLELRWIAILLTIACAACTLRWAVSAWLLGGIRLLQSE